MDLVPSTNLRLPAFSAPGFLINDDIGARRCKRGGIEIMDTVEDGVGEEVWKQPGWKK